MVLKRCCCCTLETGGLVLGCLGVFTSVMFFLIGCANLSNEIEHLRATVHNNIFSEPAEHWLHIIYFSFSIIDIFASIALLVGVIKVQETIL